MRVLVVSDFQNDPAAAGLVTALTDLGCDVRMLALEGGADFSERLRAAHRPGQRPPQVLVVDAGERLDLAYAALKTLRELSADPLNHTELGTGTPSLLAIPLGRLPGLDVRAADDFVLLPIVPAELYARLRQLDWRTAAFSSEDRVKIGDLQIDLLAYEAFVRDRKLELTHQEFELLKFLAQHPAKVWTRAELLAKVWGHRYFGGTRTVDIHIRRVRAKLGSPTDAMIETVRNVGYKLRS